MHGCGTINPPLSASRNEADLYRSARAVSGLLEKVHSVNRRPPILQSEKNRLAAILESVGRATVGLYVDFRFFVAMLGAIGASVLGVALRPRSLRAASAVHHLDRVGWQAVPIMLLITFLIGGIIAQQGIFHFRKFGADASSSTWSAFWSCARSAF